MVGQACLNDAAIVLHRVLSGQVKFSIFGGYAVLTLGGPRASKDVDCIASVNKQQILNILDGKNGFVAVSQLWQDYVAFLWSDKLNRERAVLVEIFCEGFSGATFTMANVVPTLKCYPELQHCFTRIGINIQAANARAAAHDINDLPPPQPGDVQKGLLAPSNT
ncbi:predicted protein [Histoplasma capsulatum H143]|uniref:Uncharacterized protein n=1 Tax=Ajellomyces capsulatus (strain H143) TaxID=544712 RepID=C6HA70_AJECH|nr:predicted protein [Histoplasma capsulatum H143]